MPAANEVLLQPAEYKFSRTAENSLMVTLKGHWIHGQKRPLVTDMLSQLNSNSQVRTIAFDSNDSLEAKLAMLKKIRKILPEKKC
jgi:hypothetical protein